MSSTPSPQGRYLVSPLVLLERFLLCGDLSNRVDLRRSFAEIPAAQKNAVRTIVDAFPEPSLTSLREVITCKLAARNPPVLFALACAMRNPEIRKQAESLYSQAVHTGTDALVIGGYLKSMSGGGRSFRRQAALFYEGMEDRGEDYAALQFIKYRDRAGWTHRDLLRMCHFRPSEKLEGVFKFAAQKPYSGSNKLIQGFQQAQEFGERMTSEQAISLVGEFGLPWEALPSHVLRDKQVWESLLPSLGTTALIRNLGRMQSMGIDLRETAHRLLKPKRMHPIQMLSAYNVYRSGKGVMGDLRWTPEKIVVDALEAGFYASFEELETSDSPVVFGIDVSGSMANASPVAGLNCREVAAAMAMAAIRQHPFALLGFATSPVEIPLEKHWTLGMLIDHVSKMRFGATRCAAPIEYALSKAIPDAELFAVFTDNESNSGPCPKKVLDMYRDRYNESACFAAVAIQGNAQSISDPEDWGSMDICGFDSSVPGMLNNLSSRKPL